MTKPVLVYDGHCNLCAFIIRLLRKIDKKNKIEFQPFQNIDIPNKISTKTDFKNPDTVIFIKENIYYTKSQAIIEVLLHLGGIFKVFIVLKIIPSPISNFFYDRLVKYRYYIFGKTDICKY